MLPSFNVASLARTDPVLFASDLNLVVAHDALDSDAVVKIEAEQESIVTVLPAELVKSYGQSVGSVEQINCPPDVTHEMGVLVYVRTPISEFGTGAVPKNRFGWQADLHPSALGESFDER